MAKRKPARRSARSARRKAGTSRRQARIARKRAPQARTARAAAKRARPVLKRSSPRRAGRKRARKRTASASPARRTAPGLNRQRRTLADVFPTPPSSLNLDRHASAARTGRAEIFERIHKHTETSPALTAGDVDADWEKAYDSGEEAPGGDNPTPDQEVVDDVGRALGVQYDDAEELKGSEKISKRDAHRWELDPASSEDYPERGKR